MTLADVEAAARPHQLALLGACHTAPEDGLGEGTIALLGPAEPGFWDHVTAQPEFADDKPDPIDRWSARAIGSIAGTCGGRALLPFGDPPRPFIGWALRSGRAWSSPVGLLVHDQAGLMVSFRGAVLLAERRELPPPGSSPCGACADRPCLLACPVGALTGDGYRLDSCHEYLDTPAGSECMSSGCAVRRICPISQSYGRQPVQSAYHMRQFHPN